MTKLPPSVSQDRPLLGMLLLSLCLHLAVLMIVQPTRVREMDVSPPITARLLESQTSPAPVLEEVVSASPEATLPKVPETASSPPVPRPVSDVSEDWPVKHDVVASMPPMPPESGREAARPAESARRGDPVPALPAAPAITALPSVPVMIDTTWYGVRQLDVQPRALQPVNPAYPPQARRQGLEGTVKLMLKIDEFGVVQEAAVEEGEPPGVFDAAALAAFRSARFAPAQKNQRPVRALVYVRVVFRLE
jgi:periplasmic protein TonB